MSKQTVLNPGCCIMQGTLIDSIIAAMGAISLQQTHSRKVAIDAQFPH